MTRFLTLSLIAFTATSAFSQKIDFTIGARAGLQLNRRTDDRFVGLLSGTGFSALGQGVSLYRSTPPSVSAGATLEAGIGQRFGLEFGPSFRREGALYFNGIPAPSFPALPEGGLAVVNQLSHYSGRVWDMPLVGKYYFAQRGARIRPFFGAGAAATRHSTTSFLYTEVQNGAGNRSSQLHESNSARWGFGPVVNAGVAFRSGRISIVPEYRYTRDSKPFDGQKNRSELFLGFRF